MLIKEIIKIPTFKDNSLLTLIDRNRTTENIMKVDML